MYALTSLKKTAFFGIGSRERDDSFGKKFRKTK